MERLSPNSLSAIQTRYSELKNIKQKIHKYDKQIVNSKNKSCEHSKLIIKCHSE